MVNETFLIDRLRGEVEAIEAATPSAKRQAVAIHYGFCEQYIFQILRGQRGVSKALAKKMGYRLVKTKMYEEIINGMDIAK